MTTNNNEIFETRVLALPPVKRAKLRKLNRAAKAAGRNAKIAERERDRAAMAVADARQDVLALLVELKRMMGKVKK